MGADAKPNATAVAVAEKVATTVTEKVTENVSETVVTETKGAVASAVDGAKEMAANAVNAVAPSQTTKDKMLGALVGFLDVSKNALDSGVGLVKDGATVAG